MSARTHLVCDACGRQSEDRGLPAQSVRDIYEQDGWLSTWDRSGFALDACPRFDCAAEVARQAELP